MKHIKESKRYFRNANKLLKENCTVDEYGHYSDKKYVKMAGHTAWTGLLVALEPLHPKLGKGKRKSVDSYRTIFEKNARKLIKIYNSAYSSLHLYMGYDGNTSTKLKKAAWADLKILVDWAEKNSPKNLEER